MDRARTVESREGRVSVPPVFSRHTSQVSLKGTPGPVGDRPFLGKMESRDQTERRLGGSGCVGSLRVGTGWVTGRTRGGEDGLVDGPGERPEDRGS